MANESIELDTVENAADFCDKQAKGIEAEIERMGVALGIDWNDEHQVRALAKESLEHAQEAVTEYEHEHSDYRLKAKVTLFGLAAMMMDIMAKSADQGIHTHGGLAWKSFSKALMRESGIPTRGVENMSTNTPPSNT